MESIILARKEWKNAAAFISMNPETGNVVVYGKFYEDDGYRRRGHVGPITEVLGVVPTHLMNEAKEMGWKDPMSKELYAFCEQIFAKAKEVEDWFEY